MFRLVKDEAIINRMGFNNAGIDVAVENIKKSRYYKHGGIIGVNIGKNIDTPIEHALDDYLICFEKAYPYATYIAVNISSPNTPNLRNLQHGEQLSHLLSALKQRQAELAGKYIRYVPIVIKIAPDLSDAEMTDIADKLLAHRMDGVILTNTTLHREGLSQRTTEEGGVSGRPLFTRSNEVLAKFAQRLQGNLPIFGVGGIDSAETAKQKIMCGAVLIQIYTGFIYKGPSLIVDCINALSKKEG
jgi:dihydroorotate dehydrogenase